MTTKHTHPKMDKNALSRQLAVYGAQTQSKLMAMRVYILGLRGLGIEVAKNLILAGPKKVGVFDPAPVRIEDLGSNFYLTQEHIGKKTRSEACLDNLKNLNAHVDVIIEDNNLPTHIAENYDCVVVTDNYDKKYLVQLNKTCRDKNVGFIYAGNLGLYGFTFVDFGDDHKVHDKNGEQIKTAIIVGITKDADGLVYSHQDKRHGFEDGDYITFKEVKGMTQVNDKVFKVTCKSPYTFTIGDTSSFSQYDSNGRAQEVKIPISLKFNSLENSLNNPYAPGRKQLDLCSWQKIGRAEELHVILNALLSFHQIHNRLPNTLDQNDAAQISKIVKAWIQSKKTSMQVEGQFKIDNVDQQLVKNIAKFANLQISPTTSFWGGIICQQIVKLTGKYSPLRQWLHHDFLEILPTSPVTRSAGKSRYSDYTALFGNQFLQSTSKVNTFLVGAGALGCEFIKMFSLMGLGSKGKINVTDDDNIQISNLNRQFLFRKENVGGNKSEVACAAGKAMNPDVKFNPLKLRVDPQNEITFDDAFWESLNFVVNAVDNVKARLYVDSKCVWYQRTLFESGTLGTKCNSQVVIPKYSQSYGDSQDPAEETIPLCTLKNFPYQIEHTIQWARDYFEGLFVDGPQEAAKYCQNPKLYLQELEISQKDNHRKSNETKLKLQTVLKLVNYHQRHNYETCVQLAKSVFEEIIYNQIAQLAHSLPLDHKTQNGKPFWSGLKRFPTPFHFDSSDQRHLQFLEATANIFAFIFGVPYQKDPKVVAKIADNIKTAQFVPRKIAIKDQDDDKNKKEEAEPVNEQQDEQIIQKTKSELIKIDLNPDYKWNLTEFEKDDPTNYHIQFVAGIANLRARNYKIQQVDNFKVKLIAGKIIPAIATTTAMVVGAVGIQIIKKILDHKSQMFKNSFMNLALPLWVFSDLLPPIQTEDKQNDDQFLGPSKAIPSKFTNWDKLQVKGPLTVSQLMQKISEEYNVSISGVSINQDNYLYSKYSPKTHSCLGENVLLVYEKLLGRAISKSTRYLNLKIQGQTKEGVDCRFPRVKYQI